MLIAGGVYVESCVTPPRVALLGSGGRAAMAAAGLGGEVTLHTFQPRTLREDVEVNFRPMGIRVVVHDSPNRLGFDYLHPLARPRISPLPGACLVTAPVEGAEVLRFGCLEGDFRVTAGRAVHDPQSGGHPSPFRANGSTADSLALVMNANELRRLSGRDDLAQAAKDALGREGATAIVVKDGAAGAFVFEADGSSGHVPAYPTDVVYKIGSGDVFSAIFAHAWLSGHRSAADAADLASRGTAQYVEAPVFPLPPETRTRATAPLDAGGRRVLLSLAPTTTSRRWLHEQAVRGLEDLGATVVEDGFNPLSAGRGLATDVNADRFDVVLVLAGDACAARIEIAAALARGKPVVAFADDPAMLSVARELGAVGVDDLCSALYRTQWLPL